MNKYLRMAGTLNYPTYHMIIILRILDCINFIRTNSLEENVFEKFLVHKCAKMKAWLENMTFGNAGCTN